MNYNRINNLIGWLCALIATLTYVLTVEHTTSWWDTGEFISSAYKMQIVHQPGAPLFLMIQNLFGNLAMGNNEMIAFWMNVGSAVCSGLTILFLFWTITALVKKTFYPSELGRNVEVSTDKMILIMGAGAVGALAYTYTDTFWFSAVESEVYAMSSLCTAVVFWAILKWEARADEPGANRWLLLIAYIMGLSIGVHLLNLLVIPAIALVVYYRKAKNVTLKGVWKSLGIGIVVLGLILWGIIQYTIKGAAYFDLFFVNTLGMGFGSGVIVFAIVVIGSIVYFTVHSIKKQKPLLNIIMLSLTLILFGYSSFAMILIRAKANPTLNNSDPDNAFTFLSYLNREQYGDEPLIVGKFFDSEVVDMKEAGKTYRKDGDRYRVARVKTKYEYDRVSLFPRVYSDRSDHPNFYRQYLGLGPNESPTMIDNFKFFFGYQVGHMYWRYLMWNFVGRQNQNQGHGSYKDGNWISGIKFIDQARLGGQNALPDSAKEDNGRNTYYFLPFLLGLAGLFWQLKHTKRDTAVVGLLFFFTGLAIVLYLNQSPIEPRERDYAYAGSFYAFCIWVGMGVLFLYEQIAKKVKAKNAGIIAIAISLVTGPILLATENWDDHDRSEKFLARDMAKNYLNSCAPNAILFTFGDNDTYPLWYAQEVEGFRTDVRVVNLSLLGSSWYMEQMMKKVNDADALPLNIDPEKIKEGVRDVIYYQDRGIEQHVDIEDLLKIMLSDNKSNQAQLQTGDFVNILPTKKMKFQVNKDQVIKNKVVPQEWEDDIVDVMTWEYSQNHVTRAELSILSILANNNWERPVYFTITTPETSYIGLDRYLVSEGFALRLMPVEKGLEEGDPASLINTQASYENIVNNYQWGNIANARYLDPDSYRYFSMFSGSIFGQTAQDLLFQGKNKEAKEVVLEAAKNMPKKIYLMGEAMSNSILVDAMYQVGEKELARDLALRSLEYIDQNLAYYFAIAEDKGMGTDLRDTRMGLAGIIRFKGIADDVADSDIQEKVELLMNRYRDYLQQE